MQSQPAESAPDPQPSNAEASANHEPIPTSQYSYDELAEIYNQARVDYIVPMPMNGKRMIEYVTNYDIDMIGSTVAIDPHDREVNGLCMLGVRDDRSWITRLGVIPHRRRRHVGQFLMHYLLDYSRERDMHLTQLEVIKGNEPAYRLFRKLGFEVTRELLVVRRAPGKLQPDQSPPANAAVLPIDERAIPEYLAMRGAGAAWTEESASLLNGGNLKGFAVTLASGESGWLVFQRTPFQLMHFVFSPNASPEMMRALITTVHHHYPLQDTKIENLAAEDPVWPILQQYGYVEAFRRIEMALHL